MINKRFLNFKTYNGFLAKKDQISEDSIVFIQDKPCIWARGKEYVCDGPYSSNIQNNVLNFRNVNNSIVFTITQNNGVLTLRDSDGNELSTEYVSKNQFDNFQRSINSRLDTKVDSIYITDAATQNDIINYLSDYQRKLIARSGIRINANNEISCTLDTSVYEVVSELPEGDDINPNKFYIKQEQNEGETIFVQYKWDEDSNGFVSFGRIQPTITLSEYITRDEAGRSFAPKGQYITDVQFDRTIDVINQRFSADRDDIDDIYRQFENYLTTEKAEQVYQQKGDFALRQDVADALTRLQQVIDQKYVLKADVYHNQDVDWSSSTPVDIPVNQSDNGSSDDEPSNNEPSNGGSNCDCSSKMVTLTASQYAQLVEDNLVQQDVYYFTYEGEAPSAGWQFGGAFPITFTENWAFGQAFPITLN